jgi:hypothetical protein
MPTRWPTVGGLRYGLSTSRAGRTRYAGCSDAYERTNNWHSRFRGLLVRWERKAEIYRAMVQLALALIAFQASHWFCGVF